MTRVLVTGGTGFVGSHVVDAALARGHAVRAAIRSTSNLRWLRGKDLETVEADLATDDLAPLVQDVDVTLHVAGLTRGDAAALERANVLATRRLAEALSAHAPGTRVVFLSSFAAAGEGALDQPMANEAPPAPDSDYGRTKLAAERVLLATAELAVTVLRPGGVYGPRDEDTLPFFRMSARGIAFTPGVRRRQIQLVHATDVARACLLASEADVAIGRTYFVNHPEILEWPRVVQAMGAALGRRVVAIPVPSLLLRGVGRLAGWLSDGRPGQLDARRARDMVARAWTADVEPAVRDLEWSPDYDVEAGFLDTVRWYREQGWL